MELGISRDPDETSRGSCILHSPSSPLDQFTPTHHCLHATYMAWGTRSGNWFAWTVPLHGYWRLLWIIYVFISECSMTRWKQLENINSEIIFHFDLRDRRCCSSERLKTLQIVILPGDDWTTLVKVGKLYLEDVKTFENLTFTHIWYLSFSKYPHKWETSATTLRFSHMESSPIISVSRKRAGLWNNYFASNRPNTLSKQASEMREIVAKMNGAFTA